MTDQEILDVVNSANWPELPPEEEGDAEVAQIKCGDCKEMKATNDFHASNHKKNVKNRHGRQDRCKACAKKYNSAYHKTPEGKASDRNTNLKRKYGIDQAKYERMLAAQGGKCAICPATEPGGSGEWHVDHDHDTGEVRGLLCTRCNVGIGLLRHNPAILLSAMKYITKHIVPDMIE